MNWAIVVSYSVRVKLGSVVIGGSVNFSGGIGRLRENGIEAINLSSQECIKMLADYIAANPEIWNGDIGEE